MNSCYVATILVLYNAGPLDISWAINSDKVGAILESFLPAQVIELLSFDESYAKFMHAYEYLDWW